MSLKNWATRGPVLRPGTDLRGLVSEVRGSVLDLLFPPVCRFCGESVGGGVDFCRNCFFRLTQSERLMASACRRCGLPRVRGASDVEQACFRCPKKPFVFESVTAAWVYQDAVCEAIVAAKFAWHADLADAMGRRLADQILGRFDSDRPEVVTFVPSHHRRAVLRGGNSSETMASAVARRLGLPLKRFLRTTRPIAKQAWLSDPERLENVHDAFDLKKRYASRIVPRWRSLSVSGRHILVVDDVLTTGATANEVARTLVKAGARRVSLAVIARAVRKP